MIRSFLQPRLQRTDRAAPELASSFAGTVELIADFSEWQQFEVPQDDDLPLVIRKFFQRGIEQRQTFAAQRLPLRCLFDCR